MSTEQRSRRLFLQQVQRYGLLSALGFTTAGSGLLFGCASKPRAQIVIIGGGFGGATCARYLRKLDTSLAVTLIDAQSEYVSCPFSNAVLAGMQGLRDLTFRYDDLREKFGVNVIQDTITTINSDQKTIIMSDGSHFPYDKLIISPGVQFRWGNPDGYDEAASEVMPHAWKAGPQTQLLRDQLLAMPDGGVVAIAPPAKPFRCPPGPYERASLIASYLRTHKPKSKILILDANAGFAKQALFEQGWQTCYADMIEWVPVTEGGAVQHVDPTSMTLHTDLDEHKVDVANVIPAQIAAQLAVDNGLADQSGWCPVDAKTFESTLIPNIYVLGDAILAGEMPKSASSANSQAKVCALAIAAEMNGLEPGEPSFHNTCYSLIDNEYGISVNAIYGLHEGKIQKIAGSGGESRLDASPTYRADEAKYAKGWFDSITADTFGI